MSNTTDKMLNFAHLIAEEIEQGGKQYGASQCRVDDWGKYGNFSLILYLKLNKDNKPIDKNAFSLTRLVFLIKKVIANHKDSGARLRTHECPRMTYSSNSCQGMRFRPDFKGYERTYITIDLDFLPYHEESNTFATQMLRVDNPPTELPEQVSDRQLKLF